VPCHLVSVVLFDFTSHEGTILALEGAIESSIKAGACLPLESFDFGNLRMFGSGQVHLVDDVHALSQLAPVIQRLKGEGLRSYLTVPLFGQAKLIGSLNLGANTPAAFTAEHVEIAREVADLLAVAIQQASLYEQVEQHAAELELQAMRDPLTGVPNRILLYDRLQQAILRGQRTNNPVALFILDVDHFKEINDTLGHQTGDQVLKELCPRLQQALRESDTLARLGGDEFGLLLPETDCNGAVLVAQKVLQLLEYPFLVKGQSLEVKVSLGIALYPDHGMEVSTLMRHADQAMYRAKNGRSGYVVYTAEGEPHTS
jgi:diguanylate cyclase (GGDEF)-like protein